MAIELFDSDWQSVEKLIDTSILVMRLMTGIQALADRTESGFSGHRPSPV